LKALNTIQTALFFSTFLIGIQIGRTKPFWKRYTSVLDIPSSNFGPEGKVLKGRAVRVSDGDTLRFLHVPSPFNPTRLNKSKGEKLSETALPIRLCTIDTPETSKFGKPGQPFGPEAKARMKELCEDKMIRVKLLQKDQYGRAVATVVTGRWPFRRAVDEIMLKEGLAEVYQGGGAVYGRKGLAKYLELEEEARRAKLGIWSLKKRESAAEYKKRTK
jgi:endonuclease YncB( thermonuclease family)